MEKCTLCKERTDAGEEPMCVVCCPTHARVFGDLDDPNSELAQLRAAKGKDVHILLEGEGHGSPKSSTSTSKGVPL